MARHSEWRGRASRVRPQTVTALVVGYATHLYFVIGRSTPIVALLAAPVVAVITYFVARFLYDSLLRRRAHAVGGDEDEVPVRVRFFWPAGQVVDDSGLLCSENGWLVFRGRLSEWSIRAADVVRPIGSHASDGDFSCGETGPGIAVTGLTLAEAAQVREIFAAWWVGPVPDGESTLPPASPPPMEWWRTLGPMAGLLGMFGVGYAVFGFVAIEKPGMLILMPTLLPFLDGIRLRRSLPLTREIPVVTTEPSVRTERSLRDSA